jgi:sporulation protein YlmC with PRC-barrel domain
MSFLHFSDIAGAIVRDSRGREVGEVADLILDPVENRISYVSISLFSSTDDAVAPVMIPWSAISVEHEEISQLRVAVRGSTLLKLAARCG